MTPRACSNGKMIFSMKHKLANQHLVFEQDMIYTV